MTGSIVVTGASGFIGRAVLPALAEAGWEVHAAQRTADAPDVPRVRAHRADLLDEATPAALLDRIRPSHLLHLAWYTTPGRFWVAEENEDWVDATLRLLRAFAAAGGRRAVVAGSCAEYGPSPYGVAKRECHERAAAHAAEAGYSLGWARLFHPYGPHEAPQRLVPSVVQSLLAGRPVDLSHGRQRRDFVYVGDVGAALARLAASDVAGALDVGSGRATSVRELVELIVERVGRRGLTRFGALPDDGGPAEIVADPARLRDELGWEPAVALEEGIDRTVRWWSR